MSPLASWRTALRIARREARRAKGRTALVAVMIGLPVAGLSTAAVTYDMFKLTTQEAVTRDLGAADAMLSWVEDSPITQMPDGLGYSADESRPGGPKRKTDADVLAVLPAGSRVVKPDEVSVEMRTATGTGILPAHTLDVTDPIYAGHVALVRGRAPAAASEVAVSACAIVRVGADVGGTVSTADRTRTFTVVGVIEFPAMLNDQLVFAPRAAPPSIDEDSSWGQRRWLADTPTAISWDDVRRLNEKGILVRSRAVLLDPPVIEDSVLGGGGGGVPESDELALGGLLAGMCVLEVALLAGPAFAVGARRRQRQLALVAASGGTGAHVRRIVLADGVVLGLVGAACGVILGIVVAFAGRPVIEQYLFHGRAGGYRVFPLALFGIVALAVVTGLLAALVPAFVAARQPVVTALQGRRGVTRSRKRWLALGLAMTAFGVAVAAYGAWDTNEQVVLAGLVLGELGLVLCTPALVGLIARLGGRLPVAPRIALRDTGRNRSSAAPAISAVMAAVAGSMALSVFLGSSNAQNEASYEPTLPYGTAMVMISPDYLGRSDRGAVDQDAIAAALRANLPTSSVLTVSSLGCADQPAATGDSPRPCGFSAFAELPPERQCPYENLERQLTLDEQKAAARDDRCDRADGTWTSGMMSTVVDDGAAVAAVTGAGGDDLVRAAETLQRGGIVVTSPALVKDGNATLVVESWREDGVAGEAKRFSVPAYAVSAAPGLSTLIVSPQVAARAGAKVVPFAVVAVAGRAPTQAEIDAANGAVRGVDGRVYLSVEQGPSNGEDPTMLVLAIIAGVVALGAAGVATGLAAADGRADLSILAAVGASPGLRRLLSLSQSGVIAGLGAVLGVAAGTGVAAAVLFALNRVYADRWPAPLPMPILIPWTNVALLAIVVPVVAMLGPGQCVRT